MSGYLTAHPWDTYGAPPKPGTEYPDNVEGGGEVPFDIVEKAVKAAEFLRYAQEAEEEAEEASERARNNERQGEALLKELSDYPNIVRAIENDPYDIDDAADVAKAQRGLDA